MVNKKPSLFVFFISLSTHDVDPDLGKISIS